MHGRSGDREQCHGADRRQNGTSKTHPERRQLLRSRATEREDDRGGSGAKTRLCRHPADKAGRIHGNRRRPEMETGIMVNPVSSAEKLTNHQNPVQPSSQLVPTHLYSSNFHILSFIPSVSSKSLRDRSTIKHTHTHTQEDTPNFRKNGKVPNFDPQTLC